MQFNGRAFFGFFRTARVVCGVVSLSLLTFSAFAQESGMLDQVRSSGASLWGVIRSGGLVMVPLGLLSIIAVALGITYAITLRSHRAVPSFFLRRTATLLDGGKIQACRQLCEENGSLVAGVLLAGLEVAGRERYVIQEAMQSEGSRAASLLWQRVTYLADIAVLSPLLGILGTVMGMIHAFQNIAHGDAVAKPIFLAQGISEALVTTAAGLLIAIPVMAVYFYFRGRVQNIVATAEAAMAQFVDLLTSAETHS